MPRWQQGEHVVIVGMSGSGKTTLARALLDRYRHWRVMLVTKPDDLTWRGWTRVRAHEAIDPRRGPAWRLDPSYDEAPGHFRAFLDRAWSEGGWCVYADELYHLQHAGLERDLVRVLTQGRSKRLTVVGGIQRPAWVTRFALSEPRYTFCFRVGDRRDAKALGDGLGKAFQDEVETLGRYEFAFHDKVTGQISRGTSRDAEGVFEC